MLAPFERKSQAEFLEAFFFSRSRVALLALPTSFPSGYGIEISTDVFRIPTGFHIIAQGCGTPLPWVSDVFPSLFSTPTELRRFSNTVPQLTQPRWGKRELGRFPTQGSGVPQPWALFLNPVGILNSNIRFSPLLFIAKKMWVMTRVQLGNEETPVGAGYLRPGHEMSPAR